MKTIPKSRRHSVERSKPSFVPRITPLKTLPEDHPCRQGHDFHFELGDTEYGYCPDCGDEITGA